MSSSPTSGLSSPAAAPGSVHHDGGRGGRAGDDGDGGDDGGDGHVVSPGVAPLFPVSPGMLSFASPHKKKFYAITRGPRPDIYHATQ